MTNSRFSRLSVFLTLVMLASVASAQTLSVLYNFGSASGCSCAKTGRSCRCGSGGGSSGGAHVYS